MHKSRMLMAMAALAFGAQVDAVSAATINDHYEIDLNNYRACKVDANGNRLYTCYGNDVRSGSQFYLAGGTSNSISVTNTGTVKARIEGLQWDFGTTTSFACPNWTCDLTVGSPTRYRCLTGPLTGQPCLNNPECEGYICDGGPHDGDTCNPASPDTACKSLVNADNVGTVVFGGNDASVTFVGGFATRVLNGDNSDPANGCTKLCTMNTNGSGIVDSASLSCTMDPVGCSIESYHVVKVLDHFGKVVAVPSVGDASTVPTAWGVSDVATNGDVCRGGSPPADCASDQ